MADSLLHIRFIGRAGIVEHDGFHRIERHTQITEQIVIVPIGIISPEHQHIAAACPFQKPAHGRVAFCGSAHQTNAPLGLTDQIGGSAHPVGYIRLGLRGQREDEEGEEGSDNKHVLRLI